MRGIHKLSWLTLALTLTVTAAAADDTAQSFMKDRQTELSTLVKKGAAADNSKKVEGIFDSILDYDALAQGALKDHWASRNDAERREFQDTLKRLVQRAYRKNLDRTADYDVRFEGQTKEAETFIVRTVAQSRSNAREEPVSIDYVVHRVGGVWRISDIVTEGSSLVRNYQQQFNRIIKKDGFPELLRRMKTKLESG